MKVTMRHLAVAVLLLPLWGCKESRTPAQPAPPVAAPPATATPSPVPTPTPALNQMPVPVFKVHPMGGPAPLEVTFNLCPSYDPENDPIVFIVYFGDGETHQGPCRVRHTYEVGRYRAGACIWDNRPDHVLFCRDYLIEAR